MREDGFMTKTLRGTYAWLAALFSLVIPLSASGQSASAQIGREVAIPVHLQRGVACVRVLDGVRFPAACRTFCDFCRHHVFRSRTDQIVSNVTDGQRLGPAVGLPRDCATRDFGHASCR